MSRLNSITPPPPPPLLQNTAAEEPPKNGRRVLQDRVWESLSELCSKMDNLENKPFRLASAVPGSTLDVSTSFLRTEQDYDWFDLDKDGGIILQPKIPMFPEDFPPGQPLHSLAWWGIVDPAVGERKNPRVITASGVEREIKKKPEERKRVITASGVEREIKKKPEERKRSQSVEGKLIEPVKKRSKTRSPDRTEDIVSQRNEGRRDLHRRSPNSHAQHSRLRHGPPPPPPPQRDDSYSGPPRDDWYPGPDQRKMGDRRYLGPPGGDRGNSDNFHPTIVERRHYPDDRGRYDPSRRDDRGRSDRGRY